MHAIAFGKQRWAVPSRRRYISNHATKGGLHTKGQHIGLTYIQIMYIRHFLKSKVPIAHAGARAAGAPVSLATQLTCVAAILIATGGTRDWGNS